MAEKNDITNRVTTLRRTFHAPVQLVWEAWTQPEHISQWWGPKGMEIKVIEHNFKVGGKWKYTMQMPDRSEFISEGIYSEIVELKKIITSADFKPMTEGVVLEVLFEGNGDTTEFTFNVLHSSEEYRKQQENMGFHKGWGSVFDRLDNYLVQQVGS